METNVESTHLPKVIHEDRPLSHGAPARPVLGLPIARLIPQDVHSMFDYAGGLTTAMAGLLADSVPARVSATSLGVCTLGVSLLTDYRLSAWKLIPIEVHEVLDYVVGIANLAAPLVLGYRKREPLVSAIQIVGGAADLLVSLFTDYRAYHGRRVGFER